MNRLYGVLLIAISSASFGAMPIFARLAYASGTDPISVLFLRFSLAALFMIIFLKARGISLPRGRHLITLSLMGGLGYVGQSFCYFTALTMVSAGLVALLLYLYPAFVMVLTVVFFKARFTGPKILALCLSLGGTFLIVGLDGGGAMLGILLGLSAPLIYAVYVVVGSRVIQRTGALASSTVVMLAAGAVFGGLVAARGLLLPDTFAGWVSVLAIVLVSTVLAIVTFFSGLKRLEAAQASIISTLEPVVTVYLASLVLGEAITAAKIAGGTLIVSAVILLTLNRKS
ncbi:MAG: DMT family transporter [Desulfatiglandales bacterium]